jgi:CubicO group peptidase (beta-lactamase class C family)
MEGHADVGFDAVADAFEANVASGRELGGAVSLVRDGHVVVDLWAGVADRRTGRPWTRHTPVVIFSCTKGLMTIALYRLVEEGRLDLDAPVADHWPGFAANGKGAITVRDVLTHRAGLAALDATLTREELLSWDPVIAAIEAQPPLWEPGSGYTYHAKTFGWLTGEIVRRVTGMSPGAWFRRTVAAPLGAATRIGTPIEEQADVARTEAPWPTPAGLEPGPPMTHIQARAVTMNGVIPFPDVDGEVSYNAPDIRAAELPGGNGISSAHDLAVIYGACVGDTGTRLLARASIDDALVLRSSGPEVFGPQAGSGRWGTGFMLDSPPFRQMLGPRSFGHDGAGGLMAFGDDEHRVGFGYVTNQMGGPGDDRVQRLVAAVRQSLGIRGPGRRALEASAVNHI